MEPDIDKIEAYLSGALTGAERQAFEAGLAENPALADEVDAVRLAQEAVELSISNNLRSQFQEWQGVETTAKSSQEAKVVKMAPRHQLRRLLSIAASVLLILVAGSFWYANNQFSADKMAISYYENISLDQYTRGASSSLAEAVAAMENGNLAEADAYFQSVPEGDDQYYNARYYLAHSLHRQGKYAESISELNILNQATNRNLREDGEWLKVLNLLEMDPSQSTALQTLLSGMIEDDGHTHHNDAVQLNDQLNSFWYKLAN